MENYVVIDFLYVVAIVLLDEAFGTIDILSNGTVSPPLSHVTIFIELST